MDYIPKEVSYAVAKMEGFNRNTLRLETSGATTAGPNSIITIALPSNASAIDLRSFKVHFDIATTADASSTNVIRSKLPADTASLIQSMEIYCGGVQISSITEFNTVSRIKKLVNSSRDRDGSVDRTLSHGVVTVTDEIDEVSVIFSPKIGFFAESSTRFINTAILGDVQVRLTMAPNSVLTYKEVTVAAGGDFSDAAARAAALNCTYSVSSIHATIDTCTFGDTYERMLLDRLSHEESLKINFKETYCFALKSTTGTAHDVRFSLSASSIDACYACFRDANFEQAGQKMRTLPGAELTDNHCANHFYFKSFNNSNTQRGALRWQWSCNNVQHPMHQADVLDAAHNLTMLTDQTGQSSRGNMITGLQDFNIGKCILPLSLNCPSNPISVQSGYNSRGNNTQFSLSVTGQTLPAADPAAQITAALSTLVVVETTAQLLIGGFKQVSVQY